MATLRFHYVPEDDYDYPADDVPQDQIDAYYNDPANQPPGVPTPEELVDAALEYGYEPGYVPF